MKFDTAKFSIQILLTLPQQVESFQVVESRAVARHNKLMWLVDVRLQTTEGRVGSVKQ